MIVKSLLIKGAVGLAATGAAVAGVAVTGVGVTGAAADPGSPASPGSPGPAASGDRVATIRHLMRHLEHGEFTAATKAGDKAFEVQRGQVAAVNATTLVVTSHDGFRATYALTDHTKRHLSGGTAGTLEPGERVAVLASQGVALRVRELPERPDASSGA